MTTTVSKSMNPFFLTPPYRVNRHQDVTKLGAVSQWHPNHLLWNPAAVFAVRKLIRNTMTPTDGVSSLSREDSLRGQPIGAVLDEELAEIRSWLEEVPAAP